MRVGLWWGVERLGRMATRPAARLLGEMNVLASVLIGAGMMTRGQWPFLIRHTWRQIYFTAVQRAYLFTLVGLIIGALTACEWRSCLRIRSMPVTGTISAPRAS
jgi:phospholipid/cholesterol/gamma-HCH transport system permease protein